MSAWASSSALLSRRSGLRCRPDRARGTEFGLGDLIVRAGGAGVVLLTVGEDSDGGLVEVRAEDRSDAAETRCTEIC